MPSRKSSTPLFLKSDSSSDEGGGSLSCGQRFYGGKFSVNRNIQERHHTFSALKGSKYIDVFVEFIHQNLSLNWQCLSRQSAGY